MTTRSDFFTADHEYPNMYHVDGEGLRAWYYECYPELLSYEPSATCCRGCKVADAMYDLGQDQAMAWEDMYWFGLLDEGRD